MQNHHFDTLHWATATFIKHCRLEEKEHWGEFHMGQKDRGKNPCELGAEELELFNPQMRKLGCNLITHCEYIEGLFQRDLNSCSSCSQKMKQKGRN